MFRTRLGVGRDPHQYLELEVNLIISGADQDNWKTYKEGLVHLLFYKGVQKKTDTHPRDKFETGLYAPGQTWFIHISPTFLNEIRLSNKSIKFMIYFQQFRNWMMFRN